MGPGRHPCPLDCEAISSHAARCQDVVSDLAGTHYDSAGSYHLSAGRPGALQQEPYVRAATRCFQHSSGTSRQGTDRWGTCQMTHPNASFLDLACHVGDLRFRLIDLDARGAKEGHCDCRCACLFRSVLEPVPLDQIRCD